MSIPVSKAIIRYVTPSSEKLTQCCASKRFTRTNENGEQVFLCGNKKCKKYGKQTDLVLELEKPTRYKLRPLTPEERGRMIDESGKVLLSGGTDNALLPHNVIKLWVKASLVGWENFDAPFVTEQTELLDLPGKRTMITDATYNEIPYDDALDVAWAARNFDRLTDEERKN
jgi:hypothetical protein